MSNETYSVGELAIGHGFVLAAYRNGMECEILTSLYGSVWTGLDGEIGYGMGHMVLWNDGTSTFQYPSQLRKKRPPREATTTWDHVPYWRPTQAEVTP